MSKRRNRLTSHARATREVRTLYRTNGPAAVAEVLHVITTYAPEAKDTRRVVTAFQRSLARR